MNSIFKVLTIEPLYLFSFTEMVAKEERRLRGLADSEKQTMNEDTQIGFEGILNQCICSIKLKSIKGKKKGREHELVSLLQIQAFA